MIDQKDLFRPQVPIDHFRVSPSLCFKARQSAKPLIWQWFFIFMQIKFIFARKVLHLASFKKWEFSELGDGLLSLVTLSLSLPPLPHLYAWRLTRQERLGKRPYRTRPNYPGGTQQSLYGEAPPGGPTPYPFIYRLWQKRYPFCIASIDKWYPFHIHSLELCIPFNYYKGTVFKIWINHKTRTFSRLFHSQTLHLSALLGLWGRTIEMTDVPTLPQTSTVGLPTLSRTWRLNKGPPSGWSLPV